MLRPARVRLDRALYMSKPWNSVDVVQYKDRLQVAINNAKHIYILCTFAGQ